MLLILWPPDTIQKSRVPNSSCLVVIFFIGCISSPSGLDLPVEDDHADLAAFLASEHAPHFGWAIDPEACVLMAAMQSARPVLRCFS